MARGTKLKDPSLAAALGQFLDRTLLPDLRARVAESPAVQQALAAAHAAERAAGRTADDVLAYRERTLEQVGAAWLLDCVFVRFLEDRGLVAHRRLAGDGAVDAQERFHAAFPGLAGNSAVRAAEKPDASGSRSTSMSCRASSTLSKRRYSGSSSWSTRRQKAWMVPTNISASPCTSPRASRTRRAMRAFNSAAARSVKVNATMLAGARRSGRDGSSRCAMRRATTSVLPEPAQARSWRCPPR